MQDNLHILIYTILIYIETWIILDLDIIYHDIYIHATIILMSYYLHFILFFSWFVSVVASVYSE